MTASIGELLAEARHRQGLSLKDMEKITKIRAKYLAALEENAFDTIPGDAYVVGFIRTYANYLGVDDAELIKRYRTEFNYPPTGSLGLKGASPLSSEPSRWLRVLAVALVAIVIISVLVAGLWWLRAARSFTPSTRRTSISPSRAADTRKRLPAAVAQPSSFTIRIKVGSTKGAWVRATVDGRPAYDGVLPNKATKQWEATQTITLRSGNATAVEVFRGRRHLGPLSERESVDERTFMLEE